MTKIEISMNVTNAFRQSVRWGRYGSGFIGRARKSHQCLSAVSPLGTNIALPCLSVLPKRSPMPFGSQSAGDRRIPACMLPSPTGVTNAFRQSVRWGHKIRVNTPNGDTSSPMPFGSQSAGDNQERAGLTPQVVSHQCLSAVSPLGTKCLSKKSAWSRKSPMPFGSQSAGDTKRKMELHARSSLSPMPFGSQSAGD